jgi:hypothetical protein
MFPGLLHMRAKMKRIFDEQPFISSSPIYICVERTRGYQDSELDGSVYVPGHTWRRIASLNLFLRDRGRSAGQGCPQKGRISLFPGQCEQIGVVALRCTVVLSEKTRSKGLETPSHNRLVEKIGA